VNRRIFQAFPPISPVTVAVPVDILVEDIVGICPIKIVIDCKYYKTKVDINTVDEVWGLVDDVRANYGMIVCNAGFTEGAIGRANEKGLKLCSILDLQNKEFSIKPKFPVVIETSEPTFDLVITPKNLQASLSLNPKEVIIKNLSSKEIINSYQLFFNYCKEDKIKIPEDGVINLGPNEWRLIISDEEIKFRKLSIKYKFTTKYQLGMVLAIEGKGMLDIQSKVLTFRDLSLKQINIDDVWSTWETFNSPKEIPVKPFIWFSSLAVDSDIT